MDPALVDVNVHPAKLEVRFEEENKVFKSVYYAVKEALSKKELVADAVEEKTIQKQEIAQEIATPIQNIAPVQNEVQAEILQQEADEVEKVIKEDEKTEKSGVFGFLRKNKHVDKEPEEKENMLEEIYKFRKGLKELGVAEVTSTVYTPIISDKNDKQNQEVADNTVQDETAKIEVPSEEKVQEATEELIKQRQSKEILEEAIKNSKAENPLNKEFEKDSETPEKFDTMYSNFNSSSGIFLYLSICDLNLSSSFLRFSSYENIFKKFIRLCLILFIYYHFLKYIKLFYNLIGFVFSADFLLLLNLVMSI